MMNRQREFNPRAFQVYGPKIVATGGSYDDKALERYGVHAIAETPPGDLGTWGTS